MDREKKYKVNTGKETIEREYNYIPVRRMACGGYDAAWCGHYDSRISDLQVYIK